MLLSFLVLPNVFGPPTEVAAVVDFKNRDKHTSIYPHNAFLIVDNIFIEGVPLPTSNVKVCLATCLDHHHAHQVLGTHPDRPSGNSPGALWPRRSPVTEGANQAKTIDRGLRGVEQVEHHQGASCVKTGEGFQGLLGVEQVEHHQGGGGGVFQESGPQPNKLLGSVRPTSLWV